MRLKADGSPDTTFGGGAGYVLVDGSPAHGFEPVGLALDSAGRIVVAAYHITTADVCTIWFEARDHDLSLEDVRHD